MRNALFFGLIVVAGCGVFSPSSPRVEKFDCQVRALQPLVGDVLDARQLLADLYAGRANLNALLANIEPTAAEAEELMNALRACEPPMPIPQDTVDG
jgi:hypothetical protein